ncbi:MAG: protein CpxP, partial [Polaribacter sp.]
KEQKDILFNSFYKENFNADSLTAKIGFIEEKKHAELYRFFSKVRVICSKEQAQTFDEIIQKALRAGDRRPPKEERMPPREHGMPPQKK